MKALMSTEVGGPETLKLLDVADPEPGSSDVVIAVKACSINYPDLLIIQDLYQFKPTRPFAPGSEVAGVVEAVGGDVGHLAVGDRVWALTGHDGLAEKVRVGASHAIRIPDEMDYVTASSLLMTYGTSLHALVDRGRIAAGDELLVLGASGGVGIAAVELGKVLGARVVAGVSSKEKGEFAMAAGADAVVVYDRQPFDKDASKALAAQFKAASEKSGFDVIYDAVGGDYSEPALRGIGWEGRFLVVGFPAGIARMPLNLTLLKSCDICGVFWGAFVARDPKANQAHFKKLFEYWRDGQIKPHVSEIFPLAEGGRAIEKLASREAMGKLVVTIGD